MKKLLLGLITLVIFILLKIFLFSPFSDQDIKQAEWRYNEGYKIGDGDFMDFVTSQDVYYLKNDTIYFKNNPKAIIVSSNKLFFTLTIKSLKDGEKGVYIDMEGHHRGFW
jgi:hypothetical protein